MAESFNEDDDLQRLKKWWSENGLALVLGAVVGLGGIGGWQWWKEHTNAVRLEASAVYNQFHINLEGGELTDATQALADRLKSDFKRTPYAAQAALSLARYEVEKEDYGAAIEQLQWVTANANQEAMQNIARVREARLLWAQDKSAEALRLLQHKHPPAYTPLYAELSGDIHADANDMDAARSAYEKALNSLTPDEDRSALERKLQDAGGPSGAVTVATGEPS